MIAAFLLLSFIALMLLGVPIAVGLAASGLVSIALANWDAQWLGLLAAPQNFYSSVAKYPLLALPMFVLVGSIFDRSGVAQRMVNFAIACVGRGRGRDIGGHHADSWCCRNFQLCDQHPGRGRFGCAMGEPDST